MNFGNLDVQDIKSAFNKVKAAVLNLTELEQKVREATSSEAWGASSSMMSELAKATYDYQGFNEVLPAIYKRFSQEGRTWRNVYKSLTLIEYLIKNGSEKVVDYVRAHTYELKACLNYNYIDEKGKDQGINIRHRAKLILDLLQNDDLIRAEREKAAENKAKYGGVGSDGSRSGGFGGNYGGPSSSSSSSSSNRYGGFGSNDYRPSGNYADNSSSPANASSGYPGHAGGSSNTSRITPLSAATNATPAQAPAPPKQQVADLLGFDDAPAPSAASGGSGGAASDDEWGDFASANAAPAPARVAAPMATPTPAFPVTFSTAPIAPAPTTSAAFDDDFADFQAPPPAPSMGGFASAAPAPIAAPPAAGFGAFGNASGSISPGFAAAFSSAPLTPNAPGFSGGFASNPAPLMGATSSSSSKITANTPLAQLTAANNLVDLDSLAMLGASKQPQASGPSMNSMMSMPYQPMGMGMGGMGMQQQQQPHQQQQQQGGGFGAFNAGSRPGSFVGMSGAPGQQQQQQQGQGQQGQQGQQQGGGFGMGGSLL